MERPIRLLGKREIEGEFVNPQNDNHNSIFRDCRRHIKLKHTQITELFNCDICNKNYPSKSVLKDHFRNTHVVNEVACTFCGKIFRNKTHLKKHMVYHDENKKIHKCFICPEQPAFVNKAGLNRHQSRHSNHDDKINYTCDICINYNFQ